MIIIGDKLCQFLNTSYTGTRHNENNPPNLGGARAF